MTLSEFDRRCRGYLRREAEQWRRTRWLGTVQLNSNRGPDDAVLVPEEIMPLYGDLAPQETVQVMSEEEFNRIAGLA
jgi:hypothetical protein